MLFSKTALVLPTLLAGCSAATRKSRAKKPTEVEFHTKDYHIQGLKVRHITFKEKTVRRGCDPITLYTINYELGKYGRYENTPDNLRKLKKLSKSTIKCFTLNFPEDKNPDFPGTLELFKHFEEETDVKIKARLKNMYRVRVAGRAGSKNKNKTSFTYYKSGGEFDRIEINYEKANLLPKNAPQHTSAKAAKKKKEQDVIVPLVDKRNECTKDSNEIKAANTAHIKERAFQDAITLGKQRTYHNIINSRKPIKDGAERQPITDTCRVTVPEEHTEKSDLNMLGEMEVHDDEAGQQFEEGVERPEPGTDSELESEDADASQNPSALSQKEYQHKTEEQKVQKEASVNQEEAKPASYPWGDPYYGGFPRAPESPLRRKLAERLLNAERRLSR